jgi:hypothetical protein
VNHQDLVEKVRKLLKLSENNSNPHEAALAMAKALELMAKYRLQLGEDRGIEVIEKKLRLTTINIPLAKKLLAVWIAKFFCTEVLFSTGYRERKAEVYLLGETINVDTVSKVIEFAWFDFERSFDRFFKGHYTEIQKRKRKKRLFRITVKSDYMLGYLGGLREKFEQVQNRYAVVLCQTDEVKEKINDVLASHNIRFIPAEYIRFNKHYTAHSAGYEAGKNMRVEDTTVLRYESEESQRMIQSIGGAV